MKPKNIFLIRHGESEGNIDKRVYNHTPDRLVRLTEKGLLQANQMADELYAFVSDIVANDPSTLPLPPRPDRFAAYLYCSPWLRARATAQPIREKFRIVKFYEDPRLREQGWGNYRDEDIAQKIERERSKYGTFDYRMPYGESGADVFDRITTFLDTMYRDFQKPDFPANAIIVSHGLTIKCFLMRWFHWSVEEFDLYRTPRNCEIFHMGLQPGGKYILTTPLRERANANK